jgi:hypothetical protein
MVRVNKEHLKTAGTLAALAFSAGALLISYGKDVGTNGSVQSALVKDVADIKADIKGKMQLETTLQVQLGVTISRLDELNRRLDRFEQQQGTRRIGVFEPSLVSTPPR